MRTTTKQAYTIYKIITQVNPFEYGTDEKPFIIKELKENTLTDNLSNLIEWLKVQYDNDIFNIINDTILLKLLLELITNNIEITNIICKLFEVQA